VPRARVDRRRGFQRKLPSPGRPTHISIPKQRDEREKVRARERERERVLLDESAAVLEQENERK
jgi:hypothetical protein